MLPLPLCRTVSAEDCPFSESALKTLWLMICNIKDKRSAKRAKEGQQVAASTSRLVEGEKVSRWKQTINQMTVAYPDHFDKHL